MKCSKAKGESNWDYGMWCVERHLSLIITEYRYESYGINDRQRKL